MSATEHIRALLDQRGVEHIDYGGRGHDDETGKPATWWSSEQGECAAIQRDDDLLTVEAHLTPEQAVEATLGAVRRKTHTTEYCDRCEGAVLPTWKKCPWCGEPLEEVKR